MCKLFTLLRYEKISNYCSFHIFSRCTAQTSKQIVIETKNAALVLSVATNKRVTQSYLGKKLPAADYTKISGSKEVYLTG